MKYFRKIIGLILVQAFLLSNIAWAGGLELTQDNKSIKSTLSPKVAIDINVFKSSYNAYAKKRVMAGDIILPEGLISVSDILEHGIIINNKTFNFKIGKNSFRVPPYLVGKVARLHVTAINQDGFEFQKMGIGVGRRKKTIAVALVDLNPDNMDNQLFIFAQEDTALLKALDKTEPEEIIALGRNAQFSETQRQDSFLERSKSGVEFIDSVFGLGQGQTRAKDIVRALGSLAVENSKLRSNLPINLAFFTKEYLMFFSRELVKYSNVSVLRDREQRGRFLAIVDNINPDNYIVFERKGEKVFIVGQSEPVINQISNVKKTKSFNFIDFKQGAMFCRTVSRELVVFKPAVKTGSFSIRKGVGLNFGVYNSDVSILKVNQVTQSTATGYQVKRKAPSFEDITFRSYPLYILKAEFKEEVSIDEVDINEDDPVFLFFNTDAQKDWPRYLSYDAGQNLQAYYQRLDGTYLRDGKENVVYRYIENADIYTRIKFRENNGFAISGINWKDGEPVVFRDIKNIALQNIVAQLNSSKFIEIDSALLEQFNIEGFEPGINPMRSTYIFNDGVFEQGQNENMKKGIDFSEIQKKEDKKIKKYQKKNKISIPKAALIFSVFSIVFSATNLFAAGMGDIAFDIASKYNFLESLFAGSVLVLGMIAYRVVAWAKKKFSPMDTIFVDRGRRDFIKTGSMKVLIGFLILQTGVLAFMQIFSQLKDMRMQEKLIPAMVSSLTKLAIVYEQMPLNFYAENKRLSFPMSTQFWQVFLNLSPEEAEKAASIYKENAEAVLVMYAQPNMQIQNMNAAQLLRIIASRIQGTNISIKNRKAPLLKKQDKTLQVNASDEDSTVNSMATGVAVAIISPWVPDTSNRLLETIKGKPFIVPVEPVEGVEKVKREKQRNPYQGQEERKYNDISKLGRLLSQNLDLIKDIKKSVNAKGQTYFSLKQRDSDKDDNFVIRPIKTEEEIEIFEKLADGKLNFKWKKNFNMINELRKNYKQKNRFCIYGVFTLDQYGQEQELVAAANYLIRDIDNQTVLNPLRIEVLPDMQKSGIGKALCIKVFSDALRDENLPLTKGRIFFSAENKGKGNDPFKFYTEVLKLNPTIKVNSFGENEQTLDFDLTLEDVIEFLNREFNRQGFSKELNVKGVVSVDNAGLNKLDKNQKANMLVGQSI